jgi:hypothetical protein
METMITKVKYKPETDGILGQIYICRFVYNNGILTETIETTDAGMSVSYEWKITDEKWEEFKSAKYDFFHKCLSSPNEFEAFSLTVNGHVRISTF